MMRCETVREVWERLKTSKWCRDGLCGVDICVDPVLIGVYTKAARDIMWELQKKDYIFRIIPYGRCVSVIYSDEIRNISFDEFVREIAATIYPRGDCPHRLYWRLSMLKSGIYCLDDIVRPNWLAMSDVMGCLGELAKEREVAVKAVGETYFVVIGSRKRINSPLFR